MKIYPILNNLGKGKYVFIFILNERAVAVTMNGAASRKRSSAAEADDTHASKPRHGLAAQTV